MVEATVNFRRTHPERARGNSVPGKDRSRVDSRAPVIAWLVFWKFPEPDRGPFVLPEMFFIRGIPGCSLPGPDFRREPATVGISASARRNLHTAGRKVGRVWRQAQPVHELTLKSSYRALHKIGMVGAKDFIRPADAGDCCEHGKGRQTCKPALANVSWFHKRLRLDQWTSSIPLPVFSLVFSAAGSSNASRSQFTTPVPGIERPSRPPSFSGNCE